MAQRLYVTTPIYYVNDRPHIGHAYCTILADAARRWHQLLGQETYFLTGTDEHGQKVQQAAEKRGISPQQHCDELYHAFEDLWPELSCRPDQFIRTTEPRHKEAVQRALQQLYDQGLIVPREFEGWYCTACERFWTEKELVNGNCPDCGRVVVRLKEKNWFFLMSRYQQPLIEAIQSGRMEILPAGRANEVLGFLAQPLQDLCISRPKARLSWGIELPFDRDYVTYVWFDALLNYVTAIGGMDAQAPKPPGLWPEPDLSGHANFQGWWPAVTHLLGKDILTTHAVYWPTMLMALGLPIPRRLVTTGWWLIEGAKMSKSTGNVVSPLAMKDRYGPEPLRYFLLREMAVGQDASFSEDALSRRYHADLANDLGNLVQRVIALCVKSFGGHVPEVPADRRPSDVVESTIAYADFLLHGGDLEAGEARPLRESLETFRLHRALGDTMALVSKLNQVLTFDAPFKTVKTDPEAAALTVYHVLEGVRVAAMLLWPVLPKTCEEILRRLGWTEGPLPVEALRWGQLTAGAQVQEGPPLFPRIERPVEKTPEELARTGERPALQPQVAQTTLPGKAVAVPSEVAPVDIETFGRCDLRIGRVKHAEPVPKSKKLLRLEVDLGEPAPRQILSGIAETVLPADLIGRQVLVLANLPPRLMMGLQSHGMLLVGEDEAGKRVPIGPARDVPEGTSVK